MKSKAFAHGLEDKIANMLKEARNYQVIFKGKGLRLPCLRLLQQGAEACSQGSSHSTANAKTSAVVRSWRRYPDGLRSASGNDGCRRLNDAHLHTLAGGRVLPGRRRRRHGNRRCHPGGRNLPDGQFLLFVGLVGPFKGDVPPFSRFQGIVFLSGLRGFLSQRLHALPDLGGIFQLGRYPGGVPVG